MQIQKRSQAEKPLWINDKTAGRGYLELNGRKYNTSRNYPYNVEAESAVIGCILVAGEQGNGAVALRQIGFLRHDDFYIWKNGLIFRAMEHLFQRGEAVDYITVKNQLQKMSFAGRPVLEIVGGEEYLLQLMNVVAMNIDSYGRIVVQHSLRRSIQLNAEIQAELASNDEMELEDLIAAVHKMQQDVAVRVHSMSDKETFNLYDALDQYSIQIESELSQDDYTPGIPTGFTGLDKALLGWRPSKLYIFAAPPGWGKTALFLKVALNALRNKKRVLFLSLEMPVEEMLDRMICIQGEINSLDYQKRKLNPMQLSSMRNTIKEIKAFRESKSFIISRLSRPTMQQIRSKIDEFLLDPGIDLVIIDYTNVNTISGDDIGASDEFALASHMYKQLEDMKVQYQLPIIVGTQMNSKWDSKKGKKPGETDLYYGSIGRFAADVIGYIYIPSKVKPLAPKTEAEILFRKNRSGPSGDNVSCMLYWQAEFTRFSDNLDYADTYYPIQDNDVDSGATQEELEF